MADAMDLEIYYSGKDLVSDGEAPTTHEADSGTVNTIVEADLTQGDDFFNGGIIEWLTGANSGLFSSVKDFDSASDTITLDEDLPVAVAVSDDFKIFLPLGGFRADELIESVEATAPSNVTGVVIDRVAAFNDLGIGTLEFIFNGGGGAEALRWTAPGDAAGSQVNTPADGTFTLTSGDISKALRVTVTFASLPGSDQSDSITITQPRHRLQGPILGAENAAGVTRYAAFFPRNGNATDKLFTITVFLRTGTWIDNAGVQQTAAATTVGAGGYAAAGAVTIPVADASDYPQRGHILNQDTNEIMQYNSRDGDNFTVSAAARGIRGSSAAAGSLSDDIILIPPIDIGIETPSGGGNIQTITDENTAPAAISFSAPISEATGLLIGDFDPTDQHGVWIRETVIAGGVPQLNVLKTVRFAYEIA